MATAVGQAPKVDESSAGPRGARLFIAPIEGGYDIYLAAAIHKKEVPVVIVTERSKADFEVSGVTESEKAGWAKIIFLGTCQHCRAG